MAMTTSSSISVNPERFFMENDPVKCATLMIVRLFELTDASITSPTVAAIAGVRRQSSVAVAPDVGERTFAADCSRKAQAYPGSIGKCREDPRIKANRQLRAGSNPFEFKRAIGFVARAQHYRCKRPATRSNARGMKNRGRLAWRRHDVRVERRAWT